jgi:hypothetical protein
MIEQRKKKTGTVATYQSVTDLVFDAEREAQSDAAINAGNLYPLADTHCTTERPTSAENNNRKMTRQRKKKKEKEPDDRAEVTTPAPLGLNWSEPYSSHSASQSTIL